MSISLRRTALLHDAALLLLAIALVAALVWQFVGHEHTFYAFDYAFYHNTAALRLDTLRASPRAALAAVYASLAGDYNELFILPITPLLLALGTGRPAYILSIALVYTLPLALLLGLLATGLLRAPRRLAFWLGAGAALLLPALWLPTLRGYPDAAAACCTTLASVAYVAATARDEPRRPWQLGASAALMGACLALAMLLRRHFIYAALAFAAATALHSALDVLRALRQRPFPLRMLLGRALFLVLAFGVMAGILGTIGLPFVRNSLSRDFNALYASYLASPLDTLGYFGTFYGGALLALAALGYVLAARSRLLEPRAARFVLLFYGCALAQWALLVRQKGEHYTLHFTPLVALGVAALAVTMVVRLRGARRGLALGGLAGTLAACAAFGLGAAPGTRGLAAGVLPVAGGPLVRADYAEVRRLVGYLRATTAGAPVYVNAGSEVFNYDIVGNAEATLYGAAGRTLALLPTPQVDSRDFYPLEQLLRAQYVVVTEPFLHQMAPDQQDVVRVVHAAFQQGWTFAGDFARLPETFQLDGGVAVSVYARQSGTRRSLAIQTLGAIERAVGQRPGNQPPWLSLDGDGVSDVLATPQGYVLAATFNQPDRDDSGATFIALDAPPAPVTIRLRASVSDRRCPPMKIRAAAIDAQGEELDAAQVTRNATDPPEVTLALDGGGGRYLQIALEQKRANHDIGSCVIELRIEN